MKPVDIITSSYKCTNKYEVVEDADHYDNITEPSQLFSKPATSVYFHDEMIVSEMNKVAGKLNKKSILCNKISCNFKVGFHLISKLVYFDFESVKLGHYKIQLDDNIKKDQILIFSKSNVHVATIDLINFKPEKLDAWGKQDFNDFIKHTSQYAIEF